MQEKTIVCLKYGTKYSVDYVNKLYSMVKRHCDYDHEFVCITEDPSELNKDIRVIPLRLYDDIQGWWYKTFLFDPNIDLKGSILFLDLDVVVFNDIGKFFNYETNEFCISRGFRKDNKNGMNSSCFRFDHGMHSYVFEEFMKDRKDIMNRLHGDQDWIQERVKTYKFWPSDWIMSYKWDMVDKEGRINYKRETSIAVFHGRPNPHELDNTWIRKNWR